MFWESFQFLFSGLQITQKKKFERHWRIYKGEQQTTNKYISRELFVAKRNS
jgi:hypothetical protein